MADSSMIGDREVSRNERQLRFSTISTLKSACRGEGLPVSGSKPSLARRLEEHGITWEAVEERYGWRARRAAEEAAPRCPEAYPPALERGELIDCIYRAGGHRKHFGHDRWLDAGGKVKVGDLQWSGPGLTDSELAEANRLRALGGTDPVKRAAWVEALRAEIEGESRG